MGLNSWNGVSEHIVSDYSILYYSIIRTHQRVETIIKAPMLQKLVRGFLNLRGHLLGIPPSHFCMTKGLASSETPV